jgi:hypothetical protein
LSKAKTNSDSKYFAFWKDIWKVSLKHGICPFGRCDLSTKACEHLERHASYDSSERFIKPEVFFIDDIEEKPAADHAESGEIWALFKKLRKYGLDNDQIGILIRKFGYGFTHRQIMEDMHFTSFKIFTTRLNRALDTLRKRGYE